MTKAAHRRKLLTGITVPEGQSKDTAARAESSHLDLQTGSREPSENGVSLLKP